MSNAKLSILKDTFEKQFSIESFKKFIREFFNEAEMLPNVRRKQIWKEYSEHIESYYTVAKYKDNEENNLIVLAVELKRNISIDRARSIQRNFISRVLEDKNLEAAIVAFYTEEEVSWRLSFVRLDYSFTDKGISLDLTPARRYSYLVGKNEPNHTVQTQLLSIFQDDEQNPTLSEIEEAFSVEKVTKDFFDQYKEKYLDLKEYLEKDESFITETKKLGFEVSKFAEQFAKKLMGQLAFLYFLQKKGWLGVRIMPEKHTLSIDSFEKILNAQDDVHKGIMQRVFRKTKDGDMKLSSKELHTINEHEAELLSDCFIGTEYDMPWGSGNKTFIREIFDFCIENTNKNFFDDYLEPFFYEALNKKRKNQYFKRFNCKIPFLNGGLFEPLEGYHWKDVNFGIPNKVFSNKKEKGKEADGILDIFERFNFTMNEDEPLEKEVAVDPEMLGKIFENLLDVSDRKSKGAFYTPREIVHYMCQESIINYLVNEVNVPYDDIKEFILYGELIRDADSRKDVGYSKEFTIKQTIFDKIVKIDDALKNVKIADPAVGSGAFPLGMLNEIVKARNNITEYIIRKDKEGVFDVKYGEKFIRKWRSPYKMKWDTIKNSIFAVDIEPSAVDIAKLRLWLSVVVEQEIDDENAEPHPLPNLDMNIHVGNSLIDEFEGIKLFDESILNKQDEKAKDNNGNYLKPNEMQMSLLVDHTDEMLKEMFNLQDRYFDEENEERKKDLKFRIDSIRDELIRYKLRKDGNIQGLKSYEDSLQKKTKPYFIWELEFAKVFKEKGGFDVVIGNPPYIKIQNLTGKMVEYFKQKYESAKGKFDIYVLFVEKSFDLINKNGISSFIHPHRFLKVDYGKGLRNHIKNNFGLKRFVYFGVEQIFDTATTYTGIFFYAWKNEYIEYAESNGIDLYSVKFKTKNYEDLREKWDFSNQNFAILDKIHYQKNTVKDVFKGIYQGLITLGDDIFVLRGKFYDDGIFRGFSKELNQDVMIEENLMKPLLKGEHIRRYSELYSDIYVFYPHYLNNKGQTKPFEEEELKVKYPLGYSYISNFREYLIEKKNKYKTNPKYWYSLHRARDMKLFNQMKIITPQLQNYPNFTIDTNCFFPDAGGYSLILDEEKISDYSYYLGILNSKLMWYFIKNTSTPFNNGYYYFKTKYLEPFGLPLEVDGETKEKIISIVENIADYKRKNEKMDVLEKELDYEIYKLYGLNEDEIKHIDQNY